MNAANVLATVSFFGLAAGLWMAWPPLGVIVPCGLLFGLLCWDHFRRG